MKNQDITLTILEILLKLKTAKIFYKLDQYREDAIAIEIVVPGERWEIEFLNDGEIQIEKFKSDGTIFDKIALEELFCRFND